MNNNGQPYFQNDRFDWVDVEITNHCNFSCWFCPREAMTRPLGRMSLDDFCRMVDKIQRAGVVRELLIGGIGEPTLHPDLPEMLRYLRDHTSLRATVITNGSRFKENLGVELLKARLHRLIISLRLTDPVKQRTSLPKGFDHQAYTRSILDLMRLRMGGDYTTNIEIAFLKPTCYSRFVLGLKGKEFVDSAYIDHFIGELSDIVGRQLPSYTRLASRLISRLSNVDNIQVADGLLLRLDGPSCWTTAVKKYREKQCFESKYGSCLGMLEHFAIYYDGTVSTCCADFDARNSLGNILDNAELMDILNGKKAHFFANSLRNKRMPNKNCRICRGGSSRIEKWANMIGTMLFTR